MKGSGNQERKAYKWRGHINLTAVCSYLMKGSYPPGLSDCDKRALRKRAKSFRLNEGELYFVEPAKKGTVDDAGEAVPNLRKVLTSEEDRRKTVLAAHVDPEGNHYGIEKTTTSVSSSYYWVGISSVVRDIIRNCAYCQAARSNVNVSITPNLSKLFGIRQDANESDMGDNSSILSSTPVQFFQTDMEPASYFWEKVELQLLGPYSCGRRRFYVAVCLDIFSLWPEVGVLVDKSPSSVTHFILNQVCRYGVMKSLILRENESVKFGDVHIRSDLLGQAGIELNLEKFSVVETKDVWDEIEMLIKLFTEEHPSSWSRCLELCMMPLRISRPERAEYTPAYLTHGREFNLPQTLSHQDVNSYIDVHLPIHQKQETVSKLMDVYSGYSESLRVADCQPRIPGAEISRTPVVACVEPGQPIPVVKVASVTVTDDDAEKYKQGENKGIPKNAVVKTVSPAPVQPLESGQRRLIVISLVDSTQKEKDESTKEVSSVVNIKMETGDSDVDEGALSTQVADPDYRTASKSKRRARRRETRPPTAAHCDRVTRTSSKKAEEEPRTSESLTETEITDSSHPIERVLSAGSHGLGCGMEDLDAYYAAVTLYKKSGKYPDGFDVRQKRVLRKISQSYFLLDDNLYYLQGAKSKKKVVVTTADQRLVFLHRAHVSDSGGHVCRSKVIERLDSWNVYWKGLTLDCDAYVRACQSCDHGRERPPRKDQQPGLKLEDDNVDVELEEPISDTEDETEENYNSILLYIQHQKYPPQCNKDEKRGIRRKSKNFAVVDGNLHLIPKNADKPHRKVLFTDEERQNAMKEAHSENHNGQNRTYQIVKEKYYWKGLFSEITDFVRRCSCDRYHRSEDEHGGHNKHIQERVSWFSEKLANMGSEEEMSCTAQVMLKTEGGEERVLGNIDNNFIIMDVDVHQQESEQLPAKQSVNDFPLEAKSEKASQDDESTEQAADVSPEHSPEESDTKTDTKLLEPNVIVVETVETRSESDDPCVTVVTEIQPQSVFAPVVQANSDQHIVVSDTGNVLVGAASSAGISEQSVAMSSTSTIVSASEPVQMMVVSSDQWNTPDLNILNERVRISYPEEEERVSLEQVEGQEVSQSILLQGVGRDALSSGNALAELVKATVGDLSAEEGMEKVSETVSAVASIAASGRLNPETGQMEVEEGEEGEVKTNYDDEDYVPEEENMSAEKEKAGSAGHVPKKTPKYTCEICGKEVRGTITYKVHMYKHTGEKPFSCDVCNKKFTNNKSLIIHKRKHTGDTPYLCNLCGKGFCRTTSLRYHLKAHELGGGVPVSCDVCGRDFSTGSRLAKHKACKHPLQARVFQCAECGKVFTAQRSLKRHMVSHQNIRQYQCQYCGRGFFRKEYLNSHLSQHPEAFDINSSQKVSKARSKKKQIVYDINHGLQVQSVVQVGDARADVGQASDSTAFVFPQESVQYEVECLTSESTLTEADLKAIHFLAQASIQGQF